MREDVPSDAITNTSTCMRDEQDSKILPVTMLPGHLEASPLASSLPSPAERAFATLKFVYARASQWPWLFKMVLMILAYQLLRCLDFLSTASQWFACLLHGTCLVPAFKAILR